MEFLYFYMLFAFSGAFTTMITVWYPAFMVARELDPSNIICQHRKLYMLLCFGFSVVFAPALLIIILNTDEFTKAFVNSILGRDQ
tara:strand:- start:595 stop:849 length:255 start_codon:yes stop_codon:yes gene_type:complete